MTGFIISPFFYMNALKESKFSILCVIYYTEEPKKGKRDVALKETE